MCWQPAIWPPTTKYLLLTSHLSDLYSGRGCWLLPITIASLPTTQKHFDWTWSYSISTEGQFRLLQRFTCMLYVQLYSLCVLVVFNTIILCYYFSDLLINKADSTRVAESWVGRKMTVVCSVKVPESIQQNVMFSWMKIPSNRTVPREFHDDMRSKSFLTITTNKDDDFETLQCKAETKSTVKFHIINVTKLSRCFITQFHKKV